MRFPITKQNKIAQPIKGMGDVVAIVAEPIKTALISVLPDEIANKLRNCNCAKRRQALNDMMPFNQ